MPSDGELIDLVAAALRGDDQWDSLSIPQKAPWRADADRVIKALRSAARTGPDVAVKPLEWISCTDGTYHDLECQYEIEPLGKNFRLTRAVMGGVSYLCDADNVNACKETAQHDYEQRILCALAPAGGEVDVERPYCDPVKQGEAFYLAMYAKDGAIWSANEHQDLWIAKAQYYERLRRAAIVALPAQAGESVTGWQPIETAPKSEDVLVYCSNTKEQFVAFWSMNPIGGDVAWTYAQIWIDGDGRHSVLCRPTHWQPLPATPTITRKSEARS